MPGEIPVGETRDIIAGVLEIARERLTMEIGWVCEFEGDQKVFRVVEGDDDGWGLHDGDSMPGADSYCRRMLDGRLDPIVPDALEDPVVRDLEVTKRLGIRGYLGVPLILADGSPYGALCCASHEPHPNLRERDRRFMEVLSRVIARELERLAEEDRRRRVEAQIAAVSALTAALEARDRYTGGHSEAVVDLALRVAPRVGCTEDDLATVEQVALLHDIGKVAIPDVVLHHPGPLDDAQWLHIRQHPVIAERIVMEIPHVAHLGPDLRAHHENWDGTGYPDGLSGPAIPVSSRITHVCDAFHAMTSDRPYRPALELDEALTELRTNSGTQFWPDAVDALLGDIEERALDSSLPAL